MLKTMFAEGVRCEREDDVKKRKVSDEGKHSVDERRKDEQTKLRR